MSHKRQISDEQYRFLLRIRKELNPLDENVKSILNKILNEREYNEFQGRVLSDLRARWIRENGWHIKDPRHEDDISRRS